MFFLRLWCVSFFTASNWKMFGVWSVECMRKLKTRTDACICDNMYVTTKNGEMGYAICMKNEKCVHIDIHIHITYYYCLCRSLGNMFALVRRSWRQFYINKNSAHKKRNDEDLFCSYRSAFCYECRMHNTHQLKCNSATIWIRFGNTCTAHNAQSQFNIF